MLGKVEKKRMRMTSNKVDGLKYSSAGCNIGRYKGPSWKQHPGKNLSLWLLRITAKMMVCNHQYLSGENCPFLISKLISCKGRKIGEGVSPSPACKYPGDI